MQDLVDLLAAQDVRTPSPLHPSGLAMITALSDLARSLPGIAITPGMEIGRYQILRLLGHGGMGAVFLARYTRLHRRVAIKLLYAATQEMAELFLAEARKTVSSGGLFGSDDNLFSSSGAEGYQSLLDDALARHAARAGGIGLADQLIGQWEKPR